MNGINEMMGWSLAVGRIGGVLVRISWLLGVWMLFEVVNFSRAHAYTMIPFAMLVPLLAMAVHAVGHALGARLGGGRLEGTILSVLNNYDEVHVRLSPWSHLLAGFGGPALNLLVAAGCWGAGMAVDGLAAQVLGYCLYINLGVALINLLACQPFDGHRWWRGLLWAFLPMRKAVAVAVILGFISAVLLIVFAVSGTNFLLLFLGIMSLMATINDRTMIASGHDPVFGIDPRYGGSAPTSDRAKRKAQRAAAKAEQEADAEQEVLDRLLAKVTAGGLPSLTNGERKQLQRISQRQKERAAGG